jgi:hypothetical protein
MKTMPDVSLRPALLLLLALLMAGVPVSAAHAQEEEPRPDRDRRMLREGLRPAVEYRLGYLRAPGADVHQIVLDRARVIRPGRMLLLMSPDSHLSFGLLSAGVRFRPEADPRFRWRAGLADSDLVMRRISVGWTLVDYDRSGALHTHARWAALRGGPGARVTGDMFVFEPRLVGHVSLSTIRPGEEIYADLGPDAREFTTGFEAGYTALVTVRTHDFAVKSSYGHRALFTGTDLRLTTIGAAASFEARPGLFLLGRYEREYANSEGGRAEFNLFHAGLRVAVPAVPRSPRRR